MSNDNALNNFKLTFLENLNYLLEASNEVVIDLENIKDENIKNSIENLNSTIEKLRLKLKNNIQHLKNNIKWDHLYIGFFGETNAGKSTLVESLIKGDGRSIGDGRKDFTKTVKCWNFKKIIFLDMPGIEGNESKYFFEITKAIQKCHILFYVLEPKEPEEETLKKLRNYLNNKAKIISIINARGKPGNYQIKKSLIDENMKTIEENTIKKLTSILQNNYMKNIILNAYIGFLCTGRLKKEDFINDRNKCIQVFGSIDAAFKFSRLKLLQDEIVRVMKDTKDEIVITNTSKVVNELDNVITSFLVNKKEYDLILKEYKKQYYEKLNLLKKTLEEKKIYLEKIINITLDKLKNELIQEVLEGIEKDYIESYLQKKIKEKVDEYNEKIKQEIEENLKELIAEAELVLNEIDERLNIILKTRRLKFNLNLDISDILNKIVLNLNDIAKLIWKNLLFRLSLSSIIVSIYPIIRILKTIFCVFKAFFDYKRIMNNKKYEAKKVANDKINNEIDKLKDKLKRQFNYVFKTLNNKIREIERKISFHLYKLQSISKDINKTINEFYKIKSNISIEFVKYFNKETVDFAYIDYNLKGLVVVGRLNNEIDKVKLRLNTILQYDMFEDLINAFKLKIENGTLYFPKYLSNDTDAELVYRTLICNSHKLNIERILKEK